LLQPFGTVEGRTRGLNLELIKKTYERIFRSYDERLLTVIGHSCTSSLAMMLQFVSGKEKKNGQQLEDRLYDWMRALMIYMLNPLFGEDSLWRRHGPPDREYIGASNIRKHQSDLSVHPPTSKNSSQCLEKFILELPVRCSRAD